MLVMSYQSYTGQKIDQFSFSDDDFVWETKFVGCSFESTTLEKITFNRCEFEHCTFNYSSIFDVFFNDCKLLSCTFKGIQGIDVLFDNSYVDNCEFSNIKSLHDVGFKGGVFVRSFISPSSSAYETITFEQTLLMSSEFRRISFGYSIFNKANVRGCLFRKCNFYECDIKYTNFVWSMFKQCKIEQTLLNNVSFIKSKFNRCKISNLEIENNITFVDAYLYNTDIPEDIMHKIIIDPIISKDNLIAPPMCEPSSASTGKSPSLADLFMCAYEESDTKHTITSGIIDNTRLALPGPGMSCSSNCNIKPAINAKRAFRFFTGGV